MSSEVHLAFYFGITCSGGGPRGYAHIGVIKALKERGITIDCVCGTSAGAVIGALYCLYRDVTKVTQAISTLHTTLKYLGFIDIHVPRLSLFSGVMFKQVNTYVVIILS